MKDYQKRAVKKYQDTHYEFIKVRLNKGDREIVKAKAQEAGMSVNAYILSKIL